MSTGQYLSVAELRQGRRFWIGLVEIGLLSDDDGGGHHLVGVFRAVEEIGFVETLPLFGLADQFDQMLGRELGGGQFDAGLLGLVDIDLEPLRLLRRGALDLLVEEFWSTKDFVTNEKVLPSASSNVVVCWSVSLVLSLVTIWVTKRNFTV